MNSNNCQIIPRRDGEISSASWWMHSTYTFFITTTSCRQKKIPLLINSMFALCNGKSFSRSIVYDNLINKCDRFVCYCLSPVVYIHSLHQILKSPLEIVTESQIRFSESKRTEKISSLRNSNVQINITDAHTFWY